MNREIVNGNLISSHFNHKRLPLVQLDPILLYREAEELWVRDIGEVRVQTRERILQGSHALDAVHHESDAEFGEVVVGGLLGHVVGLGQLPLGGEPGHGGGGADQHVVGTDLAHLYETNQCSDTAEQKFNRPIDRTI